MQDYNVLDIRNIATHDYFSTSSSVRAHRHCNMIVLLHVNMQDYA